MDTRCIFFVEILFLCFLIYFSVSEYSFHFFAVWYIFFVHSRITKSIKPVAQKWSDSMTYIGRIRVKPVFKTSAFISDIGMLVETHGHCYTCIRIEFLSRLFQYSISIDFLKKKFHCTIMAVLIRSSHFLFHLNRYSFLEFPLSNFFSTLIVTILYYSHEVKETLIRCVKSN